MSNALPRPPTDLPAADPRGVEVAPGEVTRLPQGIDAAWVREALSHVGHAM